LPGLRHCMLQAKLEAVFLTLSGLRAVALNAVVGRSTSCHTSRFKSVSRECC
jgi:hypothetical protein